MFKYKKIWIIGAVASGKSTLARSLSENMCISMYELDNLVHIRKSTGDIRRSDSERDEIFNRMMKSNSWIIEGVYRDCFKSGLDYSDCILIMDTPSRVRKLRILIRWVKQILKLEHSNYRPTLNMLRNMFRWSSSYDEDYNNFMVMLEPYKEKVMYYNHASEKCQRGGYLFE